MDALLLGIYAFFVWFIFIKKKWLPWNTQWKVTVVIIPVVAGTAMILTLNVVAPSSNDIRVLKYVVQIIPTVTFHWVFQGSHFFLMKMNQPKKA
jgi:hypothetical protein